MDIGIKLADEAGTGKVSVIWDREGVTSKNFDSSMLSLFVTMKPIHTASSCLHSEFCYLYNMLMWLYLFLTYITVTHTKNEVSKAPSQLCS